MTTVVHSPGVLARLLQSPAGDLLPDSLVLLRYRSSAGHEITLPVQAARTADGLVVAAAQPGRKRWWRHFRRPAPVQVWRAGSWHAAIAEVTTAEPAAQAYRRRFHRLDGTEVLVAIRGCGLPRGPVLLRGTRLRRRWTAAVTLGEFAGFCVPALTGALTANAAALLAAGAIEGTLLGASQALVLRRAIPGLRPWRWIVATAVAATIAYLIGLTPSRVGGPLPPLLVIAGGVALVSSIGVAQWLVLRPFIDRAAAWIPITALAWIAGLGVFLAFATPLWQPGQSTPVIALIGMAGGLLMAATTATVTGHGLRRLLTDR
ncbi:hypothetical protein Aph02nite_25740 [Actinoplanes philippinensis]|uniref:Uncharacterized protein n=1 Tax=Actinoplanes philippinensis TaxID=35752 RepID=A0A1I2G665_9ACTN|nr:hypothetical protein [Actinoplanes philippinensis]GIE76624.1 hypothetical protein Aph02nite_25740 [Actinoplanes philippinensis]SFF12698.1 hypothetical protein SAMN05421541_106232 [Actinoplanes philippinensis]